MCDRLLANAKTRAEFERLRAQRFDVVVVDGLLSEKYTQRLLTMRENNQLVWMRPQTLIH